MKKCRVCSYQGSVKDFHKHNQYKDGYENLCKKCQSKAVGVSRKKYASRVNAYNKKYNQENPEKVKQWRRNIPLEKKLLWSARERSKKRGLPCTILESDIHIPEYCPVLGIKLEPSSLPYSAFNSPSLDCIIPSLGYIPGNIAVISHRANTIKNNAAIEDLERVLDWLRKQRGIYERSNSEVSQRQATD